MRQFLSGLTTACLVLLYVPPEARSESRQVTTVALSGTPASGSQGTFDHFSAPLNGGSFLVSGGTANRIAFGATLSHSAVINDGNDYGVWGTITSSAPSIQSLALEGTLASDGSTIQAINSFTLDIP